jgi:hypothetical protein
VERLYKFGSDLEEDETYDPRSDMKLVLYDSDNSKKYGVLLSVDKENAFVLELPHSRSFNPENAYTFQSIHHDIGTNSTNYDSLTTSYSSLNPRDGKNGILETDPDHWVSGQNYIRKMTSEDKKNAIDKFAENIPEESKEVIQGNEISKMFQVQLDKRNNVKRVFIQGKLFINIPIDTSVITKKGYLSERNPYELNNLKTRVVKISKSDLKIVEEKDISKFIFRDKDASRNKWVVAKKTT